MVEEDDPEVVCAPHLDRWSGLPACDGLLTAGDLFDLLLLEDEGHCVLLRAGNGSRVVCQNYFLISFSLGFLIILPIEEHPV